MGVGTRRQGRQGPGVLQQVEWTCEIVAPPDPTHWWQERIRFSRVGFLGGSTWGSECPGTVARPPSGGAKEGGGTSEMGRDVFWKGWKGWVG